jgi:hypothetical protein
MKLLRGSREPLNPQEPQIAPAALEAPVELVGAALGVWREAMPELIRAGVVRAADVGRAARACRWESLGRRLLDEADGLTGKDRAELVRLAATAHALADKTWTALGVGDPRERARMRPAPQEEDALAAFKKRHA